MSNQTTEALSNERPYDAAAALAVLAGASLDVAIDASDEATEEFFVGRALVAATVGVGRALLAIEERLASLQDDLAKR